MNIFNFIGNWIDKQHSNIPDEVHGVIHSGQCTPFRDSLTGRGLTNEEVNRNHVATKRAGQWYKRQPGRKQKAQMIPVDRQALEWQGVSTVSIGRRQQQKLLGTVEKATGYRPNQVTAHYDEFGKEFYKFVFDKPIRQYGGTMPNVEWTSETTCIYRSGR